MRGALVVGCVFALSACVTPHAAVAVSSASPVVATFGSRTITVAEADARSGDELFKINEELYELRTETAERIAVEELIAIKARDAKTTEQEWLAARIEKDLPEPTETELRALFGKVRSRVPADATFDDVRPQLLAALQRDAKTKRARVVFEELKKEASFVVVLDEPARPRKTVEGVGPTKGPADAKVTIVEFADFQCPYCSRSAQTVAKLMTEYGGKVKVTYRHFPLSFHENAPKAAEASLCADEQGRFWDFHDSLYANQDALSESDLKGTAMKLQLDLKRFESCLDSGKMRASVQRDMKEGERLGVNGTPAFFVNGMMISGAKSEEAFRRLIDKELQGP